MGSPTAATADGRLRATRTRRRLPRAWLRKHGVRYVLPWRIEDWESLRAEFEAVAREARQDAVLKLDSWKAQAERSPAIQRVIEAARAWRKADVRRANELRLAVDALDAAAEPKE